MINIIRLVLLQFHAGLMSRADIRAENMMRRYQLDMLLRPSRKRVRTTNVDRLRFVWLYRLWPRTVQALMIVHPKTLIRSHREGFRWYWRWKSRRRGGRPRISTEIRQLVRQMSRENGYVERVIGSIRRDLLDHVIVMGEAHIRRLLRAYAEYYNFWRTHLGLDKEARLARPVHDRGRIMPMPKLGGLHHAYVRL